jgi:hypothetical protein
MRRIAALALSATAMCTVLATTTGAANASTGGYGNSSFGSNARSASVTRVGVKHYFHDTSVSGVAVKGDWYWAKVNGKTEIWLDTVLYDTKADGQQVAMAWQLGSVTGLIKDLKGGGTHVTQSGWIPPTAHFLFRDMRGHWNATSKKFYYTAISTVHKVR